MIFFFKYCFSFLLLLKSFLKSLPICNRMMKFLPPSWFLGQLSQFFMSYLNNRWESRARNSLFLWFENRAAVSFFQVPINKTLINRTFVKVEHSEEIGEISLLDLPDLALECILERLSPVGLCSMAAVCSSLRERCRSDHLWERHMNQKWSKLIGDAAFREWQCHIVSRNSSNILDCDKKKGLLGYLSNVCRPILWNRPELHGSHEQSSSLPADSIMSWYLSIESGKFLFPAQVYNREVQNGRIGFLLSCYDAEISYDYRTDTFRARYSAHGHQSIEENIEWNRLRPPAVDTAAHVLHVSDCLKDLKPGDHIEVQWRRSKEFPYGWWYGVIGHLESCDRNKFHCRCQSSDTVLLEFKQYTPFSQWRQRMINRKDHREVGNEVDGFYGGIRKLYDEIEISNWKRLWPTLVME